MSVWLDLELLSPFQWSKTGFYRHSYKGVEVGRFRIKSGVLDGELEQVFNLFALHKAECDNRGDMNYEVREMSEVPV